MARLVKNWLSAPTNFIIWFRQLKIEFVCFLSREKFMSSLRMIFKNVASTHIYLPLYQLIPSLLLLGGKHSNKRIVHPCIQMHDATSQILISLEVEINLMKFIQFSFL